MVVKDNSEASDASDKKSGAPGALRLYIGDIRFLLITSRDSGEESDPCRCRG